MFKGVLDLNTQTPSRIGFSRRRAATAFEPASTPSDEASVGTPACIAQLIQVELLRRRQGLVQIQGASLRNSQFLRLFVYTFWPQSPKLSEVF